jgi:proteic killer suppression protein
MWVATHNPRRKRAAAAVDGYIDIRYSDIILIVSFKDRGTQDIYDGRSTARARRACPSRLWKVAGRKLDHLNRAHVVEDLAVPPGNSLERLRGDRWGLWSIRINDQYRICFRWTVDGPADVQIIDYH